MTEHPPAFGARFHPHHVVREAVLEAAVVLELDPLEVDLLPRASLDGELLVDHLVDDGEPLNQADRLPEYARPSLHSSVPAGRRSSLFASRTFLRNIPEAGPPGKRE